MSRTLSGIRISDGALRAEIPAEVRQRNDTFGDFLLKAPWLVSAALALIAYVSLRWALPMLLKDAAGLRGFARTLPELAPLFGFFFGVYPIVAWTLRARRAKLVDSQRSLEILRATPWKDFEYLATEAYRRLVCAVEYSLDTGPDGGVDLVLRKNGKTAVVQCKQASISVGVSVVRELFGILTAEKAWRSWSPRAGSRRRPRRSPWANQSS